MIGLVVGAAVTGLVVAIAGRATAPRVPGQVAPPARPPSAAEVVAAAIRVLDRVQPARRRARRDAQLPDALDRLASALRAGQAVGPALVELAPLVPEPLGTELRPVAAALQHGGTVAHALRTWSAGPASSSDVRLVAAALTLGADAGGEVARAVDRVAATLRERRELAGEVRSLAVQARASAAVLALAPLGFAALVATIQPGAIVFLVRTPVGLSCLALGLALQTTGTLWMARITRAAT
jgi:tight adherence protein B